MKLASLALAALAVTLPAAAGAPLRTEAVGIGLGAAPAAVAAILARDYAPCPAVRSIYHAVAGDPAERIASLSINQGLAASDAGGLDVCTYSPAGDGITDSVDARFVHPGIDPSQPLYALQFHRLYPDAVYGSPPRLRNSFDALRAQLFRQYGRPIDERRERVASSAANLASSLGIGRQVRREDYSVRYLWAQDGKLVDQEQEGSNCRCSGPFVKAVIEISRSPSTIPKNAFYVLSVTISIENQALRARQDAWNAQWQKSGI